MAKVEEHDTANAAWQACHKPSGAATIVLGCDCCDRGNSSSWICAALQTVLCSLSRVQWVAGGAPHQLTTKADDGGHLSPTWLTGMTGPDLQAVPCC
jgi:hypothetical protein